MGYGYAVGIGGLCGVLSVVLFLTGFFTGWKLRGATLPKRQPPPVSVSDEERRRQEEEREARRKQDEAFQRLQNYSPADAYGMTDDHDAI